MFSPRYVVVLALVAAVAAMPASDSSSIPKPITTINDDEFSSPWFSFPFFSGKLPSFSDFFAPLLRLAPAFAEIGPRIIAEDDKFKVIVSVKDYKKDDLKVKLKNDFLFIQGSHNAQPDDHDIFASQFIHTYTLPANASNADVTAELSSDGYLVITAPLKEGGSKAVDRDVEIVETGTPYQKEEVEDKGGVTTAEPENISTEDKKEPTTPFERETATEKDNLIPHGNEITP